MYISTILPFLKAEKYVYMNRKSLNIFYALRNLIQKNDGV